MNTGRSAYKHGWKEIVLRTFALLNVLMAIAGLLLLAMAFSRFSGRSPRANDPRHLVHMYYGRTAISVLVLLSLIASSVYLWRLERRGIVLCNLVFGFQIFYWLASAWVGGPLYMSENVAARDLGKSMIATAGIGNMGLTPQLVTGYPLIALIVLNWVWKKRRTVQPATHQATSEN